MVNFKKGPKDEEFKDAYVVFKANYQEIDYNDEIQVKMAESIKEKVK
jgi:hypothetical protein